MKLILPLLIAIIISGGGTFYWQNSIVTDYKVQNAVLEKDLSDLNQEKDELVNKQNQLEEEVADLEQEVKALKATPKNVAVLENQISFVEPNDNDHLRGKTDAKLTLVLYSDIDCPYCQRFHGTVQQLLAEYPDDLNLVYRHFPLVQLHPDAPQKAEATECVAELGGNDAFWQYLDLLFKDKTAVDDLGTVAASVGVSASDFQDCMDSDKYVNKINKSSEEAMTAGGRGTPYSILYDGQKTIPINGALPYESVKAQIESLLN